MSSKRVYPIVCAGLLHCMTAFALLATPAIAQAQDNDDAWTVSGDLRAGYFANDNTARDGTETDDEAFNARVRLALQRTVVEGWIFRARAAGRFSSEQDGINAYLRGYAPTSAGAQFGDITMDELYLGYSAPDDGYRLRLGRFQTAFALPGVASKSLHRNDSPNTDITWTDGVHLDIPLASGWRGHALVQHQHRNGSGGVARTPLDFSDSDSRATVLLGVQNSTPLGPVVDRMLSVTWMPDSLASEGLGQTARTDYTLITARTAAQWPLGGDGMRLVAGVEVGYAPDTPRGSVMKTGRGGDSDGLAWQVAASVYDIAPGHHLGAVLGRTGAGWLVSPDFRPNDTFAELAYQWRFNPQTSFEARIREREEIHIPASAVRARVDRDIYLRITHKF